jgi:hypothetical protein
MTDDTSIMSSLAASLYEEDSFGIFLLVSVVLGGGAAMLAGRAIAATWRPWWQVVVYALIGRRGALHSLRAIRRNAVVGPLLRRRLHHLYGCGIPRIPRRAGLANGQPISLD